MKKALLLFDVDGTIAESGKPMDSSIKTCLENISTDIFDIGIVGGGTFAKIMGQLEGFRPRFLFTECGSVLHLDIDGDYIMQYQNRLIEHELYEFMTLFIRAGLDFVVKEVPYISGHFVDIRNGLLYFSLMGLQGSDYNRRLFIHYDKKYHCRKRLFQKFVDIRKEYELDNKIEITMGGETGIAVYPREWNKTQILKTIHMEEYESIFFFGDRFEPHGNDYALMHTPGITGVPVNNLEETYQYLSQIIQNVKSYKKTDGYHSPSEETMELDCHSHHNDKKY